jgi:glycosyltransferase involved in cell wall biosynthesis
MPLLRVAFIVESGTDVRLVEGLSGRCALAVVARRIERGREISQPTDAPFERVLGPPGFLSFAWFVFRWLVRERSRVDAVVLQGYGLAALAGNLAARLTGRTAVMLVCSPVEAYYECRRVAAPGAAAPAGSTGGVRPYRRTEAAAIRLIARINGAIGQRYVVLSPYLASVVRTHGTGRPIDIVPVYGVDTSIFVPAMEPRQRIRERLGLPRDAALAFFSSRIAPEKDPETLLDALAILRKDGRDVRVLHLSGGFSDFVKRAAARGLEPAVIARDAIPPFTTLVEWYQAADLCVQASRQEGLGFSPLEALASGVPVVAAAVGGLRDTIRAPETGWTYPPGDAVALARAIEDVLDNPVEARTRAARGRELVCVAYEREQAFERFVRTLEIRTNKSSLEEAPQRAVAG